MRSFLRCLPALLAVVIPVSSSAQVSVILEIRHASYLQYEQVRATLSVKNETSGVLSFKSNEVDIVVTDSSGEAVDMRTSLPLSGGITLLSGATETLTVNIDARYAIQSPGKYFCRGVITRGQKRYMSAPRGIDVVAGLEIAKVRASVPDAPETVRTYTLRSWDRNSAQDLFLRVIDEDAMVCYGVFELGPFVRIFDPEITVDVSGRVRVRYQVSRSEFAISHFLSTRKGVTAGKNELRRREPPQHLRKLRGGP